MRYVEPIAETRDVLTRMAMEGEVSIGEQLALVNDRLTRRVPDVVAFSVGVVRRGLTLTYVTTQLDAARLDAAQYADDGPCEEAARTGRVVAVDHDELLDEGRWQLFAQSSAAAGIHSTLSIPVMDAGRVVGGVNLYGRTAARSRVGTRRSPPSSAAGRPAQSATPTSASARDSRRPEPLGDCMISRPCAPRCRSS